MTFCLGLVFFVGSAMFQYFIKLVPTEYLAVDGTDIKSNQYGLVKKSNLQNYLLFSTHLLPFPTHFSLSLIAFRYSATQHSKLINFGAGERGLPGTHK